jgi:hypothetical protein
MAFVKLHGSILDSSIWSQTDTTRIVWITMLAMANEHGVVEASVDGLARRAVVDMVACEAALAALLGPDSLSRDGTTGERIEKVAGGWLVLNHANYRERRTSQQVATASRVARHRAKLKLERVKAVTDNVTERDSMLHLGLLNLSPSEAEAEAEAEKNKNPLRGAAPPARRSSKLSLDPETELTGKPPWLAEAARVWLAYRAEKRQKPYARSGLKALLANLESFGPARAKAAIDHSMASNYQGLFEPGGNGARPPAVIPSGRPAANAYLVYNSPEWKKANGYE